MLQGTTWIKRKQERTTQTIEFGTNTNTFHFHEIQHANNNDEINYSGEYITEGGIETDDQKLIFTVKNISTKNLATSNDKTILQTVYSHNLKETMLKNNREQTTIRKALNLQQLAIENNYMDIGRPGRAKFLKDRSFLAKTKLPTPLPTSRKETKMELCACPEFKTIKGSYGDYQVDNVKWWCLQCKTTECQLCTKKECWLGMDYDHDDGEVERQTIRMAEELQKKHLITTRIYFRKNNPIRPDYYELSLIDFQAEWKIKRSKTVLGKF
jgi:hypothetical protein